MGINIETGEKDFTVEETKKVNTLLLNKALIQPNTASSKIAYVEKATTGTTIDGKLFIKYILRDHYSNIVVGRQFNIPTDNELVGKFIVNVTGSLATIDYEADIFKGNINLRIDKINKIENKEVISIEGYFEPLQDIDKVTQRITSELEGIKDIRFELIKRIIRDNNLIASTKKYSSEHFFLREGGVLVVEDMVIQAVKALRLSDTEYNTFITTFVVSMYFKYKRVNTLIFGNDDIFDLDLNMFKTLKQADQFWNLLVNKSELYKDVPKSFFIDLAKEGKHLYYVINSLTEPKTFNANTTVETLNYVNYMLTLKSRLKDMIGNSYTRMEDGGILVKLGGLKC